MTEDEKNEHQEAAAEAAPEAEAPADEAAAEESPEPSAEGSPEPAEGEPLSPRQRRKLERSAHGAEARPQRSAEERARERAEERRRKATRRRAWRARSRERRRGAPSAEPTPPAAKGTGKRKLRQGVVVSDKADKTITVRIDSQRAHRMYGKVVRTSSTLHAHDEGNEANVGDTVRVVESRPLSRTKRWRLVEILERAR
jgi:small subunit ribosomal protein S17